MHADRKTREREAEIQHERIRSLTLAFSPGFSAHCASLSGSMSVSSSPSVSVPLSVLMNDT